ncbi:TonB-dependent receptor [Rhodoflexus sp.]
MRHLLAALGCLWLLSAQAQDGTVKGKVTDTDGEALNGATIFVPKTSKGTVTDLEGNYTLQLPAGKYRIAFRLLGYGEKILDVTVEAGREQELNVSLSEMASELQTIVVTSTFATRTQMETPMSLSVISGKRLQQLAANSQADILRTIPGITAEGGGGEVASNVFVRGLPSGGQYQFTPIQIDGMPVLSTFGLNSSAHDVYFRNDLGMQNLEFVRGGISTLFGAGSVAGIINYESKTGSENPENAVQLEWANGGRYKVDFLNTGKVSDSQRLYYAISGTYRYDEGPIFTELPSEGIQLRANIKKLTDRSALTISGQFIDDVAQFYLPLPLNGADRSRATGNDGSTVFTLQSVHAADLGYRTPGGFFQSPIRNGSKTRGGYVMTRYQYDLGNNFEFDGKIRYSRYNHEFNLFLDGPGAGNVSVESQAAYATRVMPAGASNPVFTFVDNGRPLPANARLFENRVLDRIRPLNELTGEFNVTKQIEGDKWSHNITLGTFLTRTTATDFNVTTRFLGEFNNVPRLVNMTYRDAAGNVINHTVGGISGRGIGYVNRIISSGKQAVYLTNEIKGDRLNFDVGLRYENAVGNLSYERTASYLMDNAANIGANLRNVVWGAGVWQQGRVSTSALAIALGAVYKLSDDISLYGNYSNGYFFPELRGMRFRADGNPETYTPERINQGEIGAKISKSKFSGTVAAYYVGLSNRRQVEFLNQPDGSVDERVFLTSTRTVGVEATWSYFFTKTFSFMGNFTYQFHELTEFEPNPDLVGNWLQRQPRTMAMGGLYYDNNTIDGALTVNYMGRKFTNNLNNIELDPYNIWRLDAGYKFRMNQGKNTARLGVAVFNLFNTAGITEGSPRLGDGQAVGEFFVGRPELPRRFFIRARFDF